METPDPSSPSMPVAPPVAGTPQAAAPAVPAGPAMITIDDFVKIELKVATVLECKPHPNADKLLLLKVDLGTEQRQICAGIKAHYKPEDLVGKQIVVVANLAPRPMRGEVSQGMLLAASDASGKVIVLSPSEPVSAGAGVR